MQEFLKVIHREIKTTFLFVTHDQEEAIAMADRICVMNYGKILQLGSPTEVYYRPRSEFVARFFGDNNLIEGRLGVGGAVETPLGALPCTFDGLPVPAGTRLSNPRYSDRVLNDVWASAERSRDDARKWLLAAEVAVAAGRPGRVFEACENARKINEHGRRADSIAGAEDALLQVAVATPADLQRLLLALKRAGASRLTTMLRLQTIKPAAALAIRAT